MSDVRIDRIDAQVYVVPCDQHNGDGTLEWDSTTVIVVEAHAGGQRGTGWTYGSAAVREVVVGTFSDLLAGADAVAVTEAHERMQRAVRNDGRPGVVSHAISAVDIALWDLAGRLLGVPVNDLLGRARSSVPAYGSGGFTTYDDRTTRRQVDEWMAQGFDKIKIKVGESWGTRVERDLERIALVRRAAGDGVEVFIDANGAYNRKQAVRVAQRAASEWGVTWFEEPVSSDDLEGLGVVRDHSSLEVTAGEYGYEPSYFPSMARVVDCLQADVTRVGGWTDWLVVAHVAGAHQLDLSAHCAPSLSAPVALAATNTRHVEWFHDHIRLESMLFAGVPTLRDGYVQPTDAPGHGMVLKHADAEQFRTE